MRIIAGKAKGHNLKAPKGLTTRPTQDRIRESIFNVLANYGLIDTTVLDLFSGTGALALEAISRGAKKAVCIDKSTASIIKENTIHCHFEEQLDIRSQSLQGGAASLVGQTFDYIFSDPPYNRNLIAATIEVVSKYGLLADDGILILEHHQDELVLLPNNWKIIREQSFGYTRITYCQQGASERS